MCLFVDLVLGKIVRWDAKDFYSETALIIYNLMEILAWNQVEDL